MRIVCDSLIINYYSKGLFCYILYHSNSIFIIGNFRNNETYQK